MGNVSGEYGSECIRLPVVHDPLNLQGHILLQHHLTGGIPGVATDQDKPRRLDLNLSAFTLFPVQRIRDQVTLRIEQQSAVESSIEMAHDFDTMTPANINLATFGLSRAP